MKKILLFAIVCICANAIINCATSGGTRGGSTRGPIVNAVSGTPKAIDGTMDPVFKKAPVIETVMCARGDAKKAAHAKARLAWDPNYLYVFIEVKDPVLCDKSSMEWEQDSVEVYIDEKNSKTSSYGPGIAQYRVNFKNKASGGKGAQMGKFKTGVKIVKGGYNVTVAIPFVIRPAKAGSIVGFDFQVNDDGTGEGARTGIKDWANAYNNNYSDASGFGNAKLLP